MYIYNTKRQLAKFIIINLIFLVFLLSLFYLNFSSIFIFGSILILQFGFNIYFLNLFYYNPLFKITKEVAALLAGQPYNKVSTKSNDEFGLLSLFFNEVTKNLESVSHYLKEGTRMASELALASQIQKSVLPSSIPVIPKLDIVAKTRPAEEVGGDSFDISLNNGQYYFYLGDVTGHGAPAGLIMMMVNTLFDLFLPTVSNTKELAVKINKELKPRVNSSLFMTAAFFRWDSDACKLFYTGTGHEHLIIYRAAEGVCEVFPAGGIALAMADDISDIVEEKLISFNPQDIIVLYSDGITEAVNSKGQLYGLENLKKSVTNLGHLGNSLDVFEGIAKDVQQFVSDTLQRDDMTLLVVRFSDLLEVPKSENLVTTKWNV